VEYREREDDECAGMITCIPLYFFFLTSLFPLLPSLSNGRQLHTPHLTWFISLIVLFCSFVFVPLLLSPLPILLLTIWRKDIIFAHGGNINAKDYGRDPLVQGFEDNKRALLVQVKFFYQRDSVIVRG
jgi:hypothetical protein